MKSLYIKIFFIFFILFSFNFQVFWSTTDTCFTITWYYSPLKDQARYSTKSYEWDIRLNWWWIAWASWKEVFAWMLAAPRNYPFWTKIYLDWYWVWVVEDRWWAIVSKAHWRNSTWCDRIDVWMGYWDAWLTRALRWWKRKLNWAVVSKNTPISLEFKNTVLEKYVDLTVTPESSKEEIERLQRLFTSLDLYSWEIDWRYWSIEVDLLKYQKRVWLVDDNEDWWAGYFWVKTLSKLMADYGWVFKEKKWLPEFIVKYDFSPYEELEISPESSESDIKKLQKLFFDLKLYNGSIDGRYSSIENVLLSYQMKADIIDNNDDWWAWYFWKKTFFALQSEYWIEIISSDLEKTYWLSLKDRTSLILLAKKIDNVLEKKSKSNTNIKNKYRIKIKQRIEKFITNLDNETKKNQLRFLEARI